jgi:AraC-like DNA-binding protein
MFESAGLERWLALVELVHVLSGETRPMPIASAGYLSKINVKEGNAIDKALRYLNQNFTEPVTLSDLCGQLAVSPATCNRLFHKSLGRSFKTMLTELRISHACRLLLESEQPIVQVAYLSGFENLSNFNRHFRQLKGQTPRQYRNLMRR